MSSVLIKNGEIWNGEKFFYGDILLWNSKIEKIDDKIDADAEFIYDARGKIVSSGLVDLHVHMQGISDALFGINPEMSSIPFGVTAVADASGTQGDKVLLNSFLVKNKVFVCAGIKENKATFDGALKMLPIYGDKAVGIKLCFDTTAYKTWDATPLRETIEFAHEHGLIVMVHSTNSPVKMAEIVENLRKGDILTHAYHGGTSSALDDNFECIFKAKEKGIIIDVGYAGHVHTDFGIFKKGIECDAKPDTISTDITRCSAYKRGGRYGMSMCMSIARKLGMGEKEIFKAVTVTPAKALGEEDNWGILKEGMISDICVYEYDSEHFDLTDKAGNRVFGTDGYRCVLTVVNGEVVYRY